MKYSVGDKVGLIKDVPNGVRKGRGGFIISSIDEGTIELTPMYCVDVNCSVLEEHIAPAYTFKEIMLNIKPGESYINTYDSARLQGVCLQQDNVLIIKGDTSGMGLLGVRFDEEDLFVKEVSVCVRKYITDNGVYFVGVELRPPNYTDS